VHAGILGKSARLAPVTYRECLTTDIRTRVTDPGIDRSVQECSHSSRQLDRVRNGLAFHKQVFFDPLESDFEHC